MEGREGEEDLGDLNQQAQPNAQFEQEATLDGFEEIQGENGSTEDFDDALTFFVQRKSLPSFVGESIANPYSLLINQTLGRLSIIKKGKWNRRYDVKLIQRLELSCENARLLHIEWKKQLTHDLSPQSRLPVHNKHSYIFASAHGPSATFHFF
jgi:hypothetical protein